MKRIIVLAALVFAACDPVVGSRYVKSQEMTASAGGELTIDASENAELAGTRLSIPANALPANTEITVELGLDAIANQQRIASPVVVFGPQTLQLNADATVVLPLSKVSSGQLVSILARAGDGSSYEISASNITLDANHTQATFSVRRFGSFQAQRLNSSCSANADCASGELCVNGACTVACVPQTESCNGVDDDCDGIVDNGCNVVACNSNADCASGQQCVRNTCIAACVPQSEICNGVDDNCDGDVDEGCNPSQCNSNADCASGEQCVNGACVGACVPSTEICNGIDDDCNGIVDDNCAIDAGTFCRSNLECASGQQCVNGACQIAANDGGIADAGVSDGGSASCNTDTDCSSGQLCINNSCQVDPRGDAGVECSVDTDCASGELCINGACFFSNPSDGGAFECLTQNDCASGEDCVNGYCEAALDGGSAPFCRTDLECSPSQLCVNGVCQ